MEKCWRQRSTFAVEWTKTGGVSAPQSFLRLTAIQHRLRQNAIAAGGIVYQNMRYRSDQPAVLEDGEPDMPCTIPPVVFQQFRIGYEASDPGVSPEEG